MSECKHETYHRVLTTWGSSVYRCAECERELNSETYHEIEGLRAQLATARREGFAEGVEEAAKVAESKIQETISYEVAAMNGALRQCADAIRHLAPGASELAALREENRRLKEENEESYVVLMHNCNRGQELKARVKELTCQNGALKQVVEERDAKIAVRWTQMKELETTLANAEKLRLMAEDEIKWLKEEVARLQAEVAAALTAERIASKSLNEHIRAIGELTAEVKNLQTGGAVARTAGMESMMMLTREYADSCQPSDGAREWLVLLAQQMERIIRAEAAEGAGEEVCEWRYTESCTHMSKCGYEHVQEYGPIPNKCHGCGKPIRVLPA